MRHALPRRARRHAVAALLAVPAVLTAQGHHGVAVASADAPRPAATAASHGAPARRPHERCAGLRSPLAADRPVLPATASPELASFVDPSARLEDAARILIGCRSYVAPFASLDASEGVIAIGNGSNIQDNVSISGKHVVIGDDAIVAHGATIVGPATIGESAGKPAFVGFNSYIDGATVEGGAMVTHLARLAPGIVVHAGRKVLPGKFVRTQAEADDPALGKVVAMTDADRAFMDGVLHVNTELARHYTELYHSAPNQVSGIGRDPGHSDFNHDEDQPRANGRPVSASGFRDRIIGNVRLDNAVAELDTLLGSRVALRADEGEPFHLGRLARVQDRVTMHALEHSGIDIAGGLWIGFHAVVHGGADAGHEPHETTIMGEDVVVREWAVVFRSSVGKGTTIGPKAYVDGTTLPAGSVVPERAIVINGKQVGTVEW